MPKETCTPCQENVTLYCFHLGDVIKKPLKENDYFVRFSFEGPNKPIFQIIGRQFIRQGFVHESNFSPNQSEIDINKEKLASLIKSEEKTFDDEQEDSPTLGF